MSARPLKTTSSAGADLSVRLSIALAFADASVVVLALPQIVQRLNTSISHVTWVITAYNLALIAATLVMLPFATRLASREALVAGLAVFGLASLGSGLAGSLLALVVWRCVQGAGAGLLLCASLPLFRRGPAGGAPALASWAATAAFGAAVGPAVGGILTQLFDWRAIFLAQAPVAAFAILTAIIDRSRPARAGDDRDGAPLSGQSGPVVSLSPGLANVALALVSAGLIGALFLATVLLINVWQLSPLGAAATLAVIPIATAGAERLVPDRPAVAISAAGALVLALGLLVLALIPQRELGLTLVSLTLCGVGLGLAFPAMTGAALASRGPLFARAARTVAAREGGLVLGLVLLTPVLVNQLNAAPGQAIPRVTGAIIGSPVPLASKLELGARLVVVNAQTPDSQLPDFGPSFARVEAGQSPDAKRRLAALQREVQGIVERAVTHSFREPLLLCGLLSLLALAPLGYARLRMPHSRQ